MSTNLEHAARRLLDDWSAGRNLSEAANMLREALPDGSPLTESEVTAYREAARRLHVRDGEVEIDEGAEVSASTPPDGGAYVAAWVWVAAEEITAKAEESEPECTCCRHWRGQVDCSGVDCVTCEGCNGGED